MSAGRAGMEGARAVLEGLRRHGRDWASTPDCARALSRVMSEGTADEIVAVLRRLRSLRVLQAAQQARRRYEPASARRLPLPSPRRLTGRELVVALASWAEREPAAQLSGDRLTVPTPALARFVAQLGDEPERVVRVLRAAGLTSELPRDVLERVGPALVVRLPGVQSDAAA